MFFIQNEVFFWLITYTVLESWKRHTVLPLLDKREGRTLTLTVLFDLENFRQIIGSHFLQTKKVKIAYLYISSFRLRLYY